MASTKIVEKYSYLTSILSSYSGLEQRIKLRNIPNHLLSYDYAAVNSLEAQWLRAQMRKRQSDYTYIPMWHNVAMLSEDFMGGKALYIDNDYMYGFKNCDAIEIFIKEDVMQHDKLNMTKVVSRYEGNTIILKTTLDKFLSKLNTFILPLIRCSTQPATNMSYIYSNGTNLTMNFEDILYNPTFNISSNYINNYDYTNIKDFNLYNLPETYNNKEVFLNSPQWTEDDSLSLSIEKLTNKLDNQTGIFKYDLKNNKSYDSHTMNILLWEKKMIFNLIKFFNHMAGRYKSFYCPTWANDFNMVKPLAVGANAIYTELNDLFRYYLSNGRLKKIVIFTNDRKSYIFDILTYSYETIDNITYGKVVLSNPSTVSLGVDDIDMISFFNCVRFDSDDLQISYETCDIATSSLVMKEVDD